MFRPVPDPGPGSCQICLSAEKSDHPGINLERMQGKTNQTTEQ